ncbi:MAG: PTS sugar transporter subunit IIA [Gammaproteobacteria bacterium]|nr:PTS sugar transporter subunit IIA [Gammaproteobacteria bacterium]MBU2678263.1 PTS sugar transporter subunit IIA [Gammaproteobacteria bacterium]NNC58225.1 PTS transporter subunit EIIA [Woeseiaceae bacterium]NNL51998.1 PTS transporter subunit EIIA [Woeseiaceae bacterium]
MSLEKIIQPDGVLCNATARSKKHCLEILSELLVRSDPDISSELIFECLVDRERLGCTSLDKGAAFPHCRVDGIDASKAALMKLSEPVDFDSADGEPVDLVIGMVVPMQLDDEHLADINLVTRVLADEGLRARLRGINSSSELYKALVDGSRLVAPEAPCLTNSA